MLIVIIMVMISHAVVYWNAAALAVTSDVSRLNPGRWVDNNTGLKIWERTNLHSCRSSISGVERSGLGNTFRFPEMTMGV